MKQLVTRIKEEFLSKTTPAGIDQKWRDFKQKMTATLEYFQSLEAEFNRLEAERSKKMKKVPGLK